MDIVHIAGSVHTLNFRRGDEVMVGLAVFAKEKGITAAHITGLGAAGKLTLAYYDLETKSYEKHEVKEDVEILSLIGNIGVKEDGNLVVHAHGTFGKRDLSVIGGHIFELVISGAGEIHLTAFPGTIRRAFDEETGLTLMCPAS